MLHLSDQYQSRSQHFKQSSDALQLRYSRLALVRLIAFILGLGLFIFLVGEYQFWAIPYLLVFIISFGRFIYWHRQIQQKQKWHHTLHEINEYELLALQGKWNDGNSGERYSNITHHNSGDLDLFGPFSLFQMTNRGVTGLGCNALASYFVPGNKSSANAPELSLSYSEDGFRSIPNILKRQEAVRELAQLLDWRQWLQAYAYKEESSEKENLDLLLKWISDPPIVSTKNWLRLMLIIGPIYAIGVLILAIFFLPWWAALLLLSPIFWVLYHTKEDIDKTTIQTEKANEMLQQYAAVLEHIDSTEFQSPLLKELKALCKSKTDSAPGELRRLGYTLRQLELRNNFFAIFFNIFLLWDLQYAYRLDRWKEKNKTKLPAWFHTIAQMEALSSLANVHHNNPKWCFPTFNQEQRFTSKDLGHPLISSEHRVCNDFNMPTHSHIKLVTGSNMAGKSTFLRTIGINCIMAYTGGPVCANALSLPLLEVYTSMRTADALEENTSSFFAELKRLKTIIEAVEAGQPVLFLLDEILKGTNSRDRHKGAKALIYQLIEAGGAGLIATHDIELGVLEKESPESIENWCMEVDIEDGELHFDYKLKRGITNSFNATELMKQMGIRIME